MKRDWNLIRQLLLAVERLDDGKVWGNDSLHIANYDPSTILYHVKLLREAGMVQASIADKGNFFTLSALTWAGHEFLAAASSEQRWQQAMKMLQAHEGFSTAVLQSLLNQLALESLRLRQITPEKLAAHKI